jgi:hypothetical protein
LRCEILTIPPALAGSPAAIVLFRSHHHRHSNPWLTWSIELEPQRGDENAELAGLATLDRLRVARARFKRANEQGR